MSNLTSFLSIANKRLEISAFIFEDGILFRHDPTGNRSLIPFEEVYEVLDQGKLDAFSIIMERIEEEAEKDKWLIKAV